MKKFTHMIYEYKKGIRDLFLLTINQSKKTEIESILDKYEIKYKIINLSNGNINIFFGKEYCINVVNKINKNNLNEYTLEEEFILGTMLGYSIEEQCNHFLNKKLSESKK